MRGVILAGGKGTRMLPATKTQNKHLLSLLNVPMIYYPIQTLKSLVIEEILVVSGGEHLGRIAEHLGDGSDFGVDLTYKVQREAGGIAQALGLAQEFCHVRSSPHVAVILGDNIFSGSVNCGNLKDGSASLILKEVPDPERFGVPVFKNERLVAIEEKPRKPKTQLAVTGFYFYPYDVFEVIKTLKPSMRGELEITDVNNYYIRKGRCDYQIQGKDCFWSDAGTPESMLRTINHLYPSK